MDFVLLRSGKPWMALEVKISDSDLAPPLRYFAERARPRYAFQVVLRGARERRLPDIGPTELRVISADRFLAQLP